MVERIFLQEDFPRGYKVLQFRLGRPKGFRQWTRAIWGCDVWLGPIPFMKTTVFSNVAFWVASGVM